MAISFVNAGTPTQANSSPQSPGLPTNHAQGDLMLLICEQTSAAGITFTPPGGAGWTSIARQSDATRAMTLEVFAKTEGASESAPSVACSSAAGGWQAAILNYTGVNNVVIEDNTEVASGSAAAGTWQPTGITVNTVGAMVLSVVASKDDNALNFSVANGYTLHASGATYDGTAGNGSDYSLGVAGQTFASTGAKTCPTWNQSANGTDAWTGLTIALLPAIPQNPQPGAASPVLTASAPTVTKTDNVTITPGSVALTATRSAPAVALPQVAVPSSVALTVTRSAPAVALPKVAQPGAASATVTPSAPTITTTADVTAVPAAASLSMSASSPAVALPVVSQPGAIALAASPAAPVVTVPAASEPAAGGLSLSGEIPAVSAPAVAQPSAASLALTAFAPSVVASDHKVALPGARSVVLTASAPIVHSGGANDPLPAILVLATFAPEVTASDNWFIVPGVAAIILAGSAPTVSNGFEPETLPELDDVGILVAASQVGVSITAASSLDVEVEG